MESGPQGASEENGSKSASSHPNEKRRAYWLIGLLAWVCIFFFATSMIYLSGFRPLTLILQIASGVLLPFCLLTPAVFWMADRFPISSATWRPHLWRHAIAAALFCIVCATVSGFVLTALRPQVIAAYESVAGRDVQPEAGAQPQFPRAAMLLPPELRLSRFDLQTVLLNSFTNLPPYAGIVILAHAIFSGARLREREQHAAELASHLARARLAGLRTQLQPHFLFNTLNSISALIPKDSRKANEMLLNLSDLLRSILKEEASGEVSLREELGFLKRYLQIQQVRFEGRFTYLEDVDPSVLDEPVPFLLLQPLVENAFRHGVEPSDRHETINVRASRIPDGIELLVENTCHPPSETQEPDPASNGIGLRNTEARLKAHYGEGQSFSAGKTSDGKFIVRIAIHHRNSSKPITTTPR